MRDPGNIPRVFLSHCSTDHPFVQRVYDDLARCQIDPWLDQIDIRHGQPWLDAIFESGIPTCDSVIVYLTESSIESPMVKKEIDVSILQKLRNGHVAFLPYVSKRELRMRLRADIQTLQVVEWNVDNYDSVLPQVVAEIWRSFMARSIASALDGERVQRLEAELEVERLKQATGGGVFSGAEQADFEYIWQRLDRWEMVSVALAEMVDAEHQREVESRQFRVQVRGLVMSLDRIMYGEYDSYQITNFLWKLFRSELPGTTPRLQLKWKREPDLLRELLMYGLVTRLPQAPVRQAESTPLFAGELRWHHVLADKLNRFKYWLAFTNQLTDEVAWERVDEASGQGEEA